MLRLIKIEFQKIIFNPTIQIILGLYVLLLIPTAFGIENILGGIITSDNVTIGPKKGSPTPTEGMDMKSFLLDQLNLFSFPEAWHYIAFLVSLFKLILAVVIIIIVTNEFTYRTMRQNIIDGMSKWEAILSKEVFILVLSLFSTVFLVILTLLVGSNPGNVSTFDGFGFVTAYFLEVFLYLNFAYLISMLVKKAGLSIVFLLLYGFIIEKIIIFVISYPFPEMAASISSVLPFGVIDGTNT